MERLCQQHKQPSFLLLIPTWFSLLHSRKSEGVQSTPHAILGSGVTFLALSMGRKARQWVCVLSQPLVMSGNMCGHYPTCMSISVLHK